VRSFFQSCLIAVALVAAAAAQPSGSVILSDSLAEWRDEIRESGDRQVVVAKVFTNTQTGTVYLPHDVQHRPILIPYFKNTNFLKELLAAHSLSINQNIGKEGASIHFILLNMAREPEWREHEDAVIGHEMGHIWLYAKDYAAPVYEGKDDSCLAIMTGDLLQHGLIREELERREIDYTPYWTGVLNQSLTHLENTEPQPLEQMETCRIMSQLTVWVDVRLGLSPVIWANYDRFAGQMKRHFPVLEQMAGVLSGDLGAANLADPEVYQLQLENTLYQMFGFVRMILKRGEPEPGIPVQNARYTPADG
jgi:hypothetical protein